MAMVARNFVGSVDQKAVISTPKISIEMLRVNEYMLESLFTLRLEYYYLSGRLAHYEYMARKRSTALMNYFVI